MSLPALLKEIADKYLDGRKDAFWQHKQSGQWLIKHRDLEIAAGKAGMWFDPPTVIEADSSKCVAMVIVGHWEQRPAEWSIGEASPKNTQQAYPYAMAEKRAKDRVILKLFGIHGHIYSDEEADEFKELQTSKVGNTKEIGIANFYIECFARCEDIQALKTQFSLAWDECPTQRERLKAAYDAQKVLLG